MADNFSPNFSDILVEFGVSPGFMEVSLEWDMHYLHIRDLNALHKAVCYAREARHVTQKLNRRDIPMIVYFGRTLLRLFQHTRKVEDVNEAIEMFRQARDLFPDDSLFRQKCFDYLRVCYSERDGNVDGLLELNVPASCIQSGSSLDTLTQRLSEYDEVYEYFESTTEDFERRYYSEMIMKDLDTGIRLSQLVLGFCSSNPGRTARIQSTLANFLTWRFETLNQLQDINEAVKYCDHALELDSPNSLEVRRGLSIASTAHIKRFEDLRRQEDLDDGVRLALKFLEMQDSDFAKDAKFAFCLDCLANALRCRYSTTRDMNDLDAAIDASSRDLNIGKDEIYLPQLRSTLRDCLISRYERNRRGEDLSEMVETAWRAVHCWSANHPQRVMALAQLAYAEVLQSQVRQDPECRERAGQYIKEARDMSKVIPEFSRKVQLKLDTVALSLFSRSANSDAVIDLDKSGSRLRKADQDIEIARTIAASATLDAEVFYSHSYLCLRLLARWELTHSSKDSDEVIRVAHLMVKLGEETEDTEALVLSRSNLGLYLHHRFNSIGDKDGCEGALALLLEGFRMSGSPLLRMVLGQAAIDMLTEMAEWERALYLCREIIDLFVILNGRSQAWLDKEYLLRNFFSYGAARFASIALAAGSKAFDVLDMLETCRGSILGHIIDRRADLDELMKAHPEKAKRFKRLQDEINPVIDPSMNTNMRLEQTRRTIEAEEEIRTCIKEIRMREGFGRFLLGPTETELKVAAAGGPILIVIVSKLRSDAIIITKDVVKLLPLPGLKCEEVQRYINAGLTDIDLTNILDIGQKNPKYRKLLGWLWDNCVKLIFQKLEALGYGPAKFHVWWMCAGMANFLPFHAAGKYEGDFSETSLSRAISSYTPTLRVLTHGQQKLKHNLPDQKPRLNFILMPFTPGKENPSDVLRLDVEKEADEAEKFIGDNFCTKRVVQPSAKETIAHMAECEIVHLACHGESMLTDPSRSHLLLQATAPNSTVPEIDELRLRDVVDADLGHGKLAFLSACSTAQNKDTQLWDEVLHLVSGFQVAGYLHAIGNLWPSDDGMSVEVVERFYKHLVAAGEFRNGDNVSEALNKSLIDVAKKYPGQPLAWAQFVHFGV